MTTLIIILAAVAFVVVAIADVTIGFAEGYRFGQWVALQAGLQDDDRTPEYERGYRDAVADCSRSLINWN